MLEDIKSNNSNKQQKNAPVCSEPNVVHKIVMANISLKTTEIELIQQENPNQKQVQLNLPNKPNQLCSQTTTANAAHGASVLHILKLLCFACFCYFSGQTRPPVVPDGGHGGQSL